ncbi:MAG: hypothetical protein ACK5WZ_11660 [Pseudobdellovibrionaceae bacterium]
MKSNLIHTEKWQNQNDRLQSFLQQEYGLKPEVSLRIYPHFENAVYEVSQGTCFFYAHKKSVVLQMGSSPLISHFQKIFLREGYQVQTLTSENFLTEQSWDAWAAELKKDTSFCLLQADHPVLDQAYMTEKLELKCIEKKIYCFILHHETLKQKLETDPEFLNRILPFSVHIFRWSNDRAVDLAIAFCGDRFKTPTLMVDQLDSKSFFDQADEALKKQTAPQQHAYDKTEIGKNIRKYESQFPHPLQNIESRQNRQMMIATLNSSDFTYLQLLKVNPEWSEFLFSPNLCLNQLTTSQMQWWKSAPDLNQLRNILMVSPLLPKQNEFWAVFKEINATAVPSEFLVKI